MFFFFFNDTATPEIYTLSLHDALPISSRRLGPRHRGRCVPSPSHCVRRAGSDHWPGMTAGLPIPPWRAWGHGQRSEEHTSELQSRQYLVCRLLLEKKKKQSINTKSSDI